jgi:phosphatidate cytidylyltransferase
MKRILTAAVLIPLVLAAVFWLPVWIFSLVVGAVALISAHEFLNIAEAGGMQPFRGITFLVIALLFVAYPIAGNQHVNVALDGAMVLVVPLSPMIGLVLTLVACFLTLAFGMRRDDLASVLPGATASVFAIPYVALTLGSLVLLRDLRYGVWLLLYLFIVVWSGDIFAYYTGRAVGRHLMAPRISPKKTWEGAAASLVASIAFGSLMFLYQPEITNWLASIKAMPRGSLQPPVVWQGAVLSAVINIVAQAGDLVESLIKRGAGVKDSGALLPGHGGVLDRIDALLFAAPVLWYYEFFRNISPL